MKPILFIIIGVTAMISISILSGLTWKPTPQPTPVERPLIWSRDIFLENCCVTYFWYDPTGKYPFTRDTCCLDSIVWTPEIADCYVQTNYDTLNKELDITIICDGRGDTVYIYPSK